MRKKIYSKQAEKFLAKQNKDTQLKIRDAIEKEKGLIKLADVGINKNRFRGKIEHVRFVMCRCDGYDWVDSINYKTNCKMRKNGYF